MSLTNGMTDTTTSTPTSLSAPAHATGRRIAKLRSSCDACGASKVRCNKAQPRCSRCVASEQTCVYGLSRKFGKPPRMKTARDANGACERTSCKLVQDITCASPYADLSVLLDNVQPGTIPRTMSSNRLGNEISVSGLTALEEANPTPIWDLHDINDPFNLSFPPDDFHNVQYWLQSDNVVGDTPKSSTSAPLGGYESATKQSDNGLTATSDSPDTHNCHKLAYATLESLCNREQNAAPSSTYDNLPTQTLDNLLYRNKEATSNLTQLLKCPCSRDSHLAMLYASIISKILIWYQLAAGCKSSSWGSSPPSTKSSSPSSASSGSRSAHQKTPTLAQSTGFATVSMQITVGTFSVEDETTQDALKRQLLLSELKNAGLLIDVFGAQGANEGISGRVDDLYISLGQWLKCELSRTIRVLKSGLGVEESFLT